MEGNLEEVKTVYHAIVPDGDLVLELKKSERIFPPPQTGPKTKTVNVAKFRVNRSTMIDLPHESKKSDSVFKVMLTSWGIEARQNTVTVEDDDYEALHVFLRIIHGMSYKELFNVSHKVMWPLVKIFDKYNVSLKPLAEKWFANWYATKGNKIKQISPRELLYPCWKFNHAAGFYKASGDCIYDVKGHITEHNPTEQWGLHLPQRVIQQLNAARGRLRSIIHDETWKPACNLLSYSCKCDKIGSHGTIGTLPSGASPPCTCKINDIAPCTCRNDTAAGYIRALNRTNAWPLEDTWTKEPANTILEKLEDFNFKRQGPKCYHCDKEYNRLVNDAVEKVRKYIGGLCLDCMNNSKDSPYKHTYYKCVRSGLGSDEDDAYWNHNTRKDWSMGCRVKHDEPTWYFSFMGRRQKD